MYEHIAFELKPLDTLQFLLAKLQILGGTGTSEALMSVVDTIDKLTSQLRANNSPDYSKAITRARSGLWNLSCVLLRLGSHELVGNIMTTVFKFLLQLPKMATCSF